MPYQARYAAKMHDYEEPEMVTVTVVDVYDLAADIGKQCEVLIEKHGPEAVTALLPKLVRALELLEGLAVRAEGEERARRELAATVQRLESDKLERAECRQRFEKEIEAVEEQWRAESAELVAAVARLQDDNRRLRRAAAAPAASADGGSAPASPAREADAEMLARLGAAAELQRAALRRHELLLRDKQASVDKLSAQVEQLSAAARELRRKHKQQQAQVRALHEERAELAALAQAQQRQLEQQKCASCGAGGRRGSGAERELRAALRERDELRLRLASAERGAQRGAQQRGASGAEAEAHGAHDAHDAPVQGPLPAEPDDAPWKRHGGIRKFFRKLFVESELGVSGLGQRLARAAPAPASAPAGAPAGGPA